MRDYQLPDSSSTSDISFVDENLEDVRAKGRNPNSLSQRIKKTQESYNLLYENLNYLENKIYQNHELIKTQEEKIKSTLSSLQEQQPFLHCEQDFFVLYFW